jgi:hypothetical protein
MPRPKPIPEKARWLVLVTGLTVSIPLYAVVAIVVASSSTRPGPVPLGLRYAFYGFAFACALAALAVAPRVGSDPAKALPFEAFLRRTLFSVAIAEACAVSGLVLFLMGRNLADFLVLAGLALAVILLGVVPRGLRWFRLREEPAAGPPPVSPA